MESSTTKARPNRLLAATVALFVQLGMVSTELGADSFRCGRQVVQTGDSTNMLLKKCGEPRFKDRTYEQVKLKDGRKNVKVERWHYQKSSRSLVRSVLIYRGNIVGIKTDGR